MRKLKLFIAMSLDGFIAGPNDDLSFLKTVEKEGEDYGHAAFMQNIDTLIIGRKTYDWVAKALGSSYYEQGNLDVFVLTRTPRPDAGRLRFYTGELEKLVKELKGESGKDIYCDGGGETISQLLTLDLIDELTISVVPVLLGTGTRLFHEKRPSQQLKHLETTVFDTGLVQLKYQREKS